MKGVQRAMTTSRPCAARLSRGGANRQPHRSTSWQPNVKRKAAPSALTGSVSALADTCCHGIATAQLTVAGLASCESGGSFNRAIGSCVSPPELGGETQRSREGASK